MQTNIFKVAHLWSYSHMLNKTLGGEETQRRGALALGQVLVTYLQPDASPSLSGVSLSLHRRINKKLSLCRQELLLNKKRHTVFLVWRMAAV